MAALGTVFQMALRRPPAIKLIFNVANSVCGAGLAALTSLEVNALLRGASLAGIGPLDWQAAPALAAGAAAYTVVTALAVSQVVALSSGEAARRVFWRANRLRVVVLTGNVTLGLLTAYLLRAHRVEVLLAPAAAIILLVGAHAYSRLRADRDTWRQLQSASRALDTLDETAYLRGAVQRTRELFSAAAAEIIVSDGGDGPPVRYRARTDGAEVKISVEPDTGPATKHVHALGLPAGETEVGQLRLCFSARVRLTNREHVVLDTFRASLGTGLLNARMHAAALREAESKAWAAGHDALTGLANRQQLLAEIEAALRRGERVVSLVVVDLDHFKQVNDTLGHAAGDVLLTEVAARIVAGTRASDVAARIAGDTFAVLCPDVPGSEVAMRIGEGLVARLGEDLVLDGLRLALEARAGVACFPDDAADAVQLLTRAHVALSQTRELGRSVARYEAARDHTSVARLAVVSEVRAAIDTDQLVLHFQPQLDITTGQVAACEALVRWQHPLRGLLMPDAFVPTVERSGLVGPFTLAVLDRALAASARWAGAGVAREVSVNLSARNLLDRDLPAQVGAALERHRVPPDRLVLEITETVMLMGGLDVVVEVLAGLRRLGVQLSVDDFGTGYSSLAFLMQAQVSELKIDRSFTDRITEPGQGVALVRATTELAHGLGARVVAEGVETPAQREVLLRLGCDRLQGYLLSRPVPESELAAVTARLSAPVPTPRNVIPLPYRLSR